MASQSYLRFPTISGADLVFVAEDDLWRVSATGGRAERLTAGVAAASHPRFAPDGQTLAFTGRDEGHPEVYVMPASGGPARRLTYEGSNATVDSWRPDGQEILYSSAYQQPTARMRVLHSISPRGGLSAVLPYGPASAIAFGPHGAILLGRNGGDPARWKRYRGGTAGQFWIDPTGSGTFQRILSQQAGVAWPCFVGERLYFISDRDGFGDVYSCLLDGSDVRRHTNQRESGFYARQLTTDGQRLVYAAGGDLYLLELGAEPRQLEISQAMPRTQLARQFVPANDFLETAAIQPQGRSVALVTRGKSFSMGAWEGPVLQHGAPDGVRYRHVSWLADGKHLVAVADAGTEPRLVVFTNDGSEPDRMLDAVDIGHVVELVAAPVGQRVFLRNHRGEYLLVEANTGTARVLDRTAHGRGEMANHVRGLAWSHDGAWVAYSFGLSRVQVAIKVANTTTYETTQVTTPVLYDQMPAFDPKGRYLYFLSARDFDPVADNLGFEFSFPRGMRPYLVTLRRDLRSPFIPTPEAVKDEFEEKLEQAKKDEQDEQAKPEPVRIDLDGIASRIAPFPVDEGRYGQVQGTHSGVEWSSFPLTGTIHHDEGDPYHPSADGGLDTYTFETHKQEHVADGISAFWVTPDGKALLYRANDRLRLIKAGEKPPQPEDAEARDKPGRESGWIDLARVRVSVRPAAEWRQMFDEAWRLQREQFFRADMGGVDWQEVHDRYAPLVERVGSRGDLSDILWEMQGEIGSSHAYEIGGAYRETPEYAQGHLGVDWRWDAEAGKYRIARVVHGDPWNAEATSPLLAPGVNVAVGDAVVAINGQRLSADRTPAELLVNQAGEEVELVVEAAGGAVPRTVTPRAVGDPHAGRYRDWVEGMRQHVHLATEGRVGYIHIPDMAYVGFAEFHRSYLQEYDREALIVDVRWNSGGMVSALLLEKLMRPRLAYGYQRWGQPDPYFGEAPRGPMVAITDENAGSDGDIFSHSFKVLKLGPLIGKRTWGGVIGIDPYIPLADGTVMTQPEFGFYFLDVGWGVENYGTDPTIEVDNPPQAYVAGSDPQLERGIMEALGLLAERDVRTPTPPPWRAPGH